MSARGPTVAAVWPRSERAVATARYQAELAAAFATRRCADCGSPDVIAVAPGSEEFHWQGRLIARGEATRGWCLGCAVGRGWLTARRAAA